MATGKISKRTVEAIRPSGRDSYLWDRDLAGFGLKVTPGGARTYLVQYRQGGRQGRTRRVTIGRHGSPWTADQARQEARRILGEVAAGGDPAERKADARRELSVTELCDLYLAEGVATKKATTVATDRGRIERHIKPLIGAKRLSVVTRADVERLQQDVARGRTAVRERTGPRGLARVSGGTGAAAKSVVLLSAIFNFAMARGLCLRNPAQGVKKFPDRRRERFLSAAELARLGEALATIEAEEGNPFAIAAVRLLVLTGCRRSEILGLRWEHVDFGRAALRLPDSKTGAKVIALGAPALAALAVLPRVEGSPYVLPGASSDRPLVGLPKVWERVRQRAGLGDVRLHDLRHSFASVAAAGGDSLIMIGKLLGHRSQATTARYSHLAEDPVRAAADRIANEIARAMRGKGAEVVTLAGAPGVGLVADDRDEAVSGTPRSRTG